MNSKQKRTLEAIFRNPVSASIAWADVESLLAALGCRIVEGSGSRVRFERDGKTASFHRPHPQKEVKKYVVKIVREYITQLGEAP